MKKMKTRVSPEQGLFSFEAENTNIVNDYVRSIVKEYLKKDIPSLLYCGLVSENRSTARWSAKEILNRLDADIPPLLILEGFRDEMIRCSKLNSTAERIFQISAETAEYFIRILC